MTAIEGARGDRLLSTLSERTLRRNDPVTGRAARQVIHLLLGRADTGTLSIEEHVNGNSRSFRHFVGSKSGIQTRVEVHDVRAYTAIVREGSVGLGRGFIEGWWSADDPVAVVRYLIGNLGTLDAARNRWHRRTRWLTEPVRARRRLRGSSGRTADHRGRNRDEIEAHYDIGNDFFELFLDETLSYSSGWFEHPASPLADASLAKIDRLCRQLDLQPGQRIVEVGCGWGAFAIHAATAYGVEVVTTTLSAQQHLHTTEAVARAGLTDRIEVRLDHYRDLTGEFDALVAVEMIEAIDWRELDDFLASCARLVRPSGAVALQAIVTAPARHGIARNANDFIKTHVFPGSSIPSVSSILEAAARRTDLLPTDLSDFGMHYAETLRRWRSNLADRRVEAGDLGLDEPFLRLWDFYLSYCEAGFEERMVSVVQLVLERPGRALTLR